MKFWSKRDDASPPVETPDDPPRWVCYLDKIDRNVVHGWCFDRRHPEQSLAVEALGSGGSRSVVIACLFRQDVKDGGHGSGHLGFEIDLLNFDDSEMVTIRLAESKVLFTTAPIALDPVSAVGHHSLPQRFLRAARHLAAEVAVRHAEWARRDPSAMQGDGAPYDDRLLATFDCHTDPEGLITRIAAQESMRIARGAFEVDRVGSFQARLGVLYWFIDDYAATRPDLSRVPLSPTQIAALNAPVPIAGVTEAATVALQNFVLRHLPSHANFRDRTCFTEAVYWWCVERAPRTKFADRLVTPKQVELLLAPSHGAGTLYPCTMFMSLYARKHSELLDLDLNVPSDRLALLCYLFLASFLEPSLLRLLPQETLRRLMRSTHDGHAIFDSMLGRLAARENERGDLSVQGGELRGKGEDLLSVGGVGPRVHGRGERPVATIGKTADTLRQRAGLGVIGPYSKSSGLGRAMRLSLEAAEAIEEVPPAFLDFAMENFGPSDKAVAPRHPHLATPRDITLLHQNAEILPLAFAYAPRHLLVGSYCIAFPFWELNELADCQRLGLDLVDEVWVASEYNRQVFAKYTSKPVIRVGVAAPPLPITAQASRSDHGLRSDHFTFIATFDSFSFIARKNPAAVIEAFRRAFPLGSEPVQLVVKTQNRGRVSDGAQIRLWQRIDWNIALDPRIVLIDETLTFLELLALIRTCDAYVSLHRSEGWGFGLVEAMQLGLPVICTNYSGNVDFCTSQTAFLVDYDLILVASDEYLYVPRGSVWADPSVESAALQMRRVVDDRAGAVQKAGAAKLFVERELSVDAVSQRYAARLAAIRGGLQRKAEV